MYGVEQYHTVTRGSFGTVGTRRGLKKYPQQSLVGTRLKPNVHVMVRRVCCILRIDLSRGQNLMTPQLSMRVLISMLLFSMGVTGCASEFIIVGASGEPLLISRRGFFPDECTAMVKDDAARMGVPLRYIHIRGNAVGRSLLWPFEPGYACEGGIGPEQGPAGIYLQSPSIFHRSS